MSQQRQQRGQPFVEQLFSEVSATTYSPGAPIREWRRKRRTRGKALDCRVYPFAALQALFP